MPAATDVLDLVQQWADAERQNDGSALAPLLADEFFGVGPLGFVLTRDQWRPGRPLGQMLALWAIPWRCNASG